VAGDAGCRRRGDRERTGRILERGRDGVAGRVRGIEAHVRPGQARPGQAGGHVLGDLEVVEALLERRPVLRVEPHADRQQRERRSIAKELVPDHRDLARWNALDVVPAVREQDHHGPNGVGREVLRCLLHRRDVVRVDADLRGQGRIQPFAVRGGQ